MSHWRRRALDRVPVGPIRNEARRRTPHLAIGCVVTGLALVPGGPWPVVMAAVIAGWAARCLLGARAMLIAIALVSGAALIGALRLAAIDRPANAAPPGTTIDGIATLLEHPRAGIFGSSAVMRLESGPAKGLRFLARRRNARWPANDPGVRFRIHGFVRQSKAAGAESLAGAGAAPGMRAAAAVAGTPAAGSDPALPTEANAGEPGTPGFGPLPARPGPGDDFDFAAFLRSRGIGREVSIESLRPIGRRGGLAGLIDSLRRRAERAISAGLPMGQAALARGMVLGEDGDVADATRDDFRRSGLAHLLAASGQNVALLCALALPLLMLAGASQRMRIAVLLPLIAIYVLLAGAGASITRAGIMAAAGLIAIAAGRASSGIYALLLAAVVTLGLNPRATADPGWQLSFAAVLGMLLLGPRIGRPLRRLPRVAAEAIGATVAATLATWPLLAHQFGAISIAALPANVAAFPAVAPIMWIGMGEAAVEQLGALGPLAAIPHALEGLAAPVAGLALRWVAGVATRFADPAWAQAQIQLGLLGVGAAYAAIAAIALVCSHRGRGRIAAAIGARLGTGRARIDPVGTGLRFDPVAAATGPGGAFARIAGELSDWLRALTPASRRAYAAPLIALGVAAGAHAAGPTPPPRHLTVDFIDVGQGDSTLVRDPTGASILFDGGVPEARVDRTLRRLGVRHLSVVVATHQSRDHHGGLLQVVKRFPVGLFLDGRDGVLDPSFIALEREADRRNIARRPIRAGERLSIGGLRIRFLWPPPRTPATPAGDPNQRAAVAILSEGGFDLLLSADAESPVLLPLDVPQVDAMKVPHHGSADPGLPQLLERLRPRVAAIETGRGNPYGHPRPPTLNALRTRVPRVYRTDRDGTVELTISGDRIAIRTHR